MQEDMVNDPIARRRRRPRRLRARRKQPLIVKQILEWADEYFERTGRWPLKESGPVRGAIDTTWYGIHKALSEGRRGLPGGSSLARLLAEFCGARNRWPPYSTNIDQSRRRGRENRGSRRREIGWPVRNGRRTCQIGSFVIDR